MTPTDCKSIAEAIRLAKEVGMALITEDSRLDVLKSLEINNVII